jgi:hypothetical protein
MFIIDADRRGGAFRVSTLGDDGDRQARRHRHPARRATPRSVMGTMIRARPGVIGTLGGTLLGLVVAYHIDVIVPAIEGAALALEQRLLDRRMPSVATGRHRADRLDLAAMPWRPSSELGASRQARGGAAL